MPRFYFDLFFGPHASLDEVGSEVASFDAAATEAKRTAVAMVRDALFTPPAAHPEDVRVEVQDEFRQPVLSVTVSIRVQQTRQAPPPCP